MQYQGLSGQQSAWDAATYNAAACKQHIEAWMQSRRARGAVCLERRPIARGHDAPTLVPCVRVYAQSAEGLKQLTIDGRKVLGVPVMTIIYELSGHITLCEYRKFAGELSAMENDRCAVLAVELLSQRHDM